MERNILPFYMTYPYLSGVKIIGEHDEYKEDMEYFETMYPFCMKYVLGEVRKTLKILNYEGSMLYDDYPDEADMYKIAEGIAVKMRQKDWQEEIADAEQCDQLEKMTKHELFVQYVVVVLLQEIVKMRQESRKGKPISKY